MVFRDGSRGTLKDVVSYADIQECEGEPAIAFHGRGRQRWEVPKKNVQRMIVRHQGAGSTVSGEAIAEDSSRAQTTAPAGKVGRLEDQAPPRKP